MSKFNFDEKISPTVYAAVLGLGKVSNERYSVLEQVALALDRNIGQIYNNRNEPEQAVRVSHTNRM